MQFGLSRLRPLGGHRTTCSRHSTCLEGNLCLTAVSNFHAIYQVSSFVAVRFQDADIAFQSSDGVLFDAHKDALIFCGSNFLENSVDSEGTIHLPETRRYELLFQYVYSYLCPSLDDVPFEVVEALGDAAEKYKVRYAIMVCRVAME